MVYVCILMYVLYKIVQDLGEPLRGPGLFPPGAGTRFSAGACKDNVGPHA